MGEFVPHSDRYLEEAAEGEVTLPRYPIYIPSKGRFQPSRALTARALIRDRVPFFLVVEPQEAEAYADFAGEERVLVLPFSDLGQGSIPARNWIIDHARASGAARHWQIDDNIRDFWRYYRGERIYCRAGVALRVCEDFTDRYENVALSGLNYVMFGIQATKPFAANVHVYSCTLLNEKIPHRYRGRYNEDTDLCLQVLADDWVTLLLNAFLVQKITTMVVKGGNTDELYAGDGRLRMARELERRWPHVVRVERRWERPQHIVDWKKFRTPLIRRRDLDVDGLPPVDNYGITLTERKPVKSPRLRRMVEEANGA